MRATKTECQKVVAEIKRLIEELKKYKETVKTAEKGCKIKMK